MRSTKTSQTLVKKMEQLDADLLSRRERLGANQLVDGIYPEFIASSCGANLVDVDQNSYLDFMLAFGTVILGHADEDVNGAVMQALQKGVASSIHRIERIKLIETLCQVIPGAESAMLLKTGSDATTAAIRLAKIKTGKNKIIRWGYHGWHDWCCPREEGIDSNVREHVSTFDYHDLNSLKASFEKNENKTAALIMMPFELDEPQAGHLEEIKSITHHYGALFILDEIRSGFRVALGGAQEKYQVTADLALFSKAMANGFEISALTGRRDLLKLLGKTHVSSTFFRNQISMVAAVATIEKLIRTQAIAKIDFLGKSLLTGMKSLLDRYDLDAVVRGAPSMPFLDFLPTESGHAWKNPFFAGMAEKGVLLFPSHHWFICSAMTEKDIRETLEKMEKTILELLPKLGTTPRRKP